MAGDDATVEALITQSYAIRADSYAEFETLLKLLSYGAAPKNENILVLSNAGGMGVLLTDDIIQNKLRLVTISQKTKNELKSHMNPHKSISIHNPIDLLGDASAFDYEQAVAATEKETNIGAVIVLLTPQANTQIMKTARVLYHYQKRIHYPLLPVFMGKASVSRAHRFFEQKGMPSFRYFASFSRALYKLVDYKKRCGLRSSHHSNFFSIQTTTHQPDIHTVLSQYSGESFLNQYDSARVIAWSGISVSPLYHATTKQDLARIVRREGFPLVAKIASDKITHKTEVHGVITQITTLEELQNAYHTFTSITSKKAGCYVQKQHNGYELLVGAKRDKEHGVVLLLGVGGVYAELFKQSLQVLYPCSLDMFAHLLKTSFFSRYLMPFRGLPAINITSLHETMMKLGSILEQHKEIDSIDINPLMMRGTECVAVDARVILAKR